MRIRYKIVRNYHVCNTFTETDARDYHIAHSEWLSQHIAELEIIGLITNDKSGNT